MTRERIYKLIDAERDRQNFLIGAGVLHCPCDRDSISDFVKLGVLTEEVGEVATEVNDGETDGNGLALAIDRDKLRTELIQVAAVAVSWLESHNNNPKE